ncbi:MMPL family transporter [Streptomyces sp. XD-27]|uniref:MMPL family transporter n=1 Tax=Streptomyces sp. XD-27 TaxID=3062779 RepID=UPI0026F41E47|nr:MMPL family transporter [Streptomyces sp. XD-27]WKX68858.1 MMPL family transporter [Streptomyces sp. XD-27]
MATFLCTLGRFALRRRRLVVLLWVALLAAVGTAAVTASSPATNAVNVPGTEAQKAFDLLEERFPDSHSDGATARVVFQAPFGERIKEPVHRRAVAKAVEGLRTGPGSRKVAAVSDPFRDGGVSADGTTAYTLVSYEAKATELADGDRRALRDAARRGRSAGLVVEIGGDAMDEQPSTGVTEVIGVAVASLVLAVTFGSLVAAGLPLLTAVVGVGITVAGITALTGPLGLGSSTPILAMMLGLAVGIDYAMFIVSRFRGELAAGRDRDDAIGHAVGTAGSAVVFAGLTVIIALVGLAVVDIPDMTKMGLAAAGAVAIAVVIAITLIPALLGFAGERVLAREKRPARRGRANGRRRADGQRRADARQRPVPETNAGTRWARYVLIHPIGVLLLGVLGLCAVAVPAASLELGMPDDGTAPGDSTRRKAYDMLAEGFGPGFNGPLIVTVDARGSRDPHVVADRVHRAVRRLDDVTSASAPVFNKAGDTATITVVPASAPTSTRTQDLVTALRGLAGDEVLVTGRTAMDIDVSRKLNDALVPYLALVVGLAFLLLTVVFRSLLVPLKAALGFLLSIVAALGVVVAVFQWGWLAGLFGIEETGPITSMMPIFVIGVVFGLAMDYEVFLVTRMREAYVHGMRPAPALVAGFRHGARVVTAAAVIMISVFSGFVGSDQVMVKTIGFGLAVAVLFDAFVVRMAIVPALLALLDGKAWWLPKWLDRILPHVDVEGARLREPSAPAALALPAAPAATAVPAAPAVPVPVRTPSGRCSQSPGPDPGPRPSGA